MMMYQFLGLVILACAATRTMANGSMSMPMPPSDSMPMSPSASKPMSPPDSMPMSPPDSMPVSPPDSMPVSPPDSMPVSPCDGYNSPNSDTTYNLNGTYISEERFMTAQDYYCTIPAVDEITNEKSSKCWRFEPSGERAPLTCRISLSTRGCSMPRITECSKYIGVGSFQLRHRCMITRRLRFFLVVTRPCCCMKYPPVAGDGTRPLITCESVWTKDKYPESCSWETTS